MPSFKQLIATSCAGFITTCAFAEAQRTFFTVENQMPDWSQLEVGVGYAFDEKSDDKGFVDVDTTTVTADARYGLTDRLAGTLSVPFSSVDGGSDDNTGIGDVAVGLQLLAYENVFGFPYVIPHVSVTLPTGDEDDGLGAGDSTVTPGITVGNMAPEYWHWSADLSYRMQGDEANQFIVSGALVYELSEDFQLVAEARFIDSGDDTEDNEVLYAGGFSYDWSENLQFDVNFGASAEGNVDVFSNLGATLSF